MIAAYRQSRYGSRYTAQAAQKGVPTACESLRQMDPARDDYVKRLQYLGEWRIEEGLPVATTGSQVATTFLDYLDALFFTGLSHADGSKTWAALQALVPKVSQNPDLVARIRRAVDGFAKRAPAGSRDPPPEEVIYAVVGWLLWNNFPLAALNELMRFLCGARPGEIDHLTVRQLIAPSDQTGHWCVLYNPSEALRPGKTGEYDEGVTIDQPHIKPLHHVFSDLIQGRNPSDNLWQTTPEQMNKHFQNAMDGLGLSHLNIVRYSWRHAAASHDLLKKLRTQEEVKARFRWRSDASMKRYAKAARVEFFKQQIPVNVLKYGTIVKEELTKMFAGQKIRPP